MTLTPPSLPELPALRNDSSMLTRRFGSETINYFAGSRLNRYSFLRSDSAFLQRAARSPAARYIALDNLDPLVADEKTLGLLQFDHVKTLTGSEPFKASDADRIERHDSSAQPDPLIVFLGTAATHDVAAWDTAHGKVSGQPFFAIDVTPRGRGEGETATWLKRRESEGLSIATDTRSLTLHAEAAAIFAQARSVVDWNMRNIFCAGCGNRNLSVEAGYKRVCPPTDLKGTSEPSQQADCPTRRGVSNICFPRTDPTMIAAVVSADGQRLLLGRQSRWPPNMFSTLAGFLEPGEAVEEAVRREVWEEAGVQVGRVVLHSTQPWPYPANLMIGAIAQSLPGDGEEIRLNDKELESAKWFTLKEVRSALEGSSAATSANGPERGVLRLPPPQAIANRLLTAVVGGYLSGIPKM